MKIGIMGGTFNPIHNGHLSLAAIAKQSSHLDEVWFMPSGLPAHKSNTELASAKDRLAMVKLAITEIPGFVASSFEIDRPGFTYTADTVEALSKEYPEHEFYFIIGGDSLMKFHHWVKPDVISKHVTLLAAGRNGLPKEKLLQQSEELFQRFGTKVCLLSMKELSVSSNQIRSCCRQNLFEALKNDVPDAVVDYIVANNLYQQPATEFQ